MVCGLCLFVIMWAWGFNVCACFVRGLLCDGVWCGVVSFVCSCVFMCLRVMYCVVKCGLFVVFLFACVCLYSCVILCAMVCCLVLCCVCVFVSAFEHVCVSCL